MAPPLTSKLPATGTTIFTIMSQLAARHGAINLSQGFPDFQPPEALVDRVTHYLRAGANQYAPMTGVEPLFAGCGFEAHVRPTANRVIMRQCI